MTRIQQLEERVSNLRLLNQRLFNLLRKTKRIDYSGKQLDVIIDELNKIQATLEKILRR